MANGTPGVRTLNTLAANTRRASNAVGTRPGAEIALPASAQAKLDYLERGGRDFRASTPTLDREIEAAYVEELQKVIFGKAPASAPWEAAAAAYLKRLQLRLETGGADVQGLLARLDRQTIEQKGHSRIGYASGDLLRQVRAAKIRQAR